MNPLDDRTAEEKLPQNKDLFTFLRRVTVSSDTRQETSAQAIARVRSRLLEEGQLHMEDVPQLNEHEETSQEKVPSMALLRKRPVWQQRFSLLVAVLCVALLVSAFVAVEQLAHHSSTTTGAPSQNGSHAKGGQYVYFQIVEVHMHAVKPEQYTVTIQKGMGIELISDGHILQVISNGYWNGPNPVPLKEKGMPTVNTIRLGSDGAYQKYPDSQVVGPFNTVGTFHLYDEIHGDTTIIITVQE